MHESSEFEKETTPSQRPFPKNLSHTRLTETICRKKYSFQEDTVSNNRLEICFVCVLLVFAPCPPCPMLKRQRQDATKKFDLKWRACQINFGSWVEGGQRPIRRQTFWKIKLDCFPQLRFLFLHIVSFNRCVLHPLAAPSTLDMGVRGGTRRTLAKKIFGRIVTTVSP